MTQHYQLATTWRGVLLGLIPVVIIIGKSFNVPFTETDLTELIEGFATAASAILIVIGLIRKFYLDYFKKEE